MSAERPPVPGATGPPAPGHLGQHAGELAPGQVASHAVTPTLELSVRLQIPGFTLAIEGRCEAFPLLVLGPSGSGKTTLLEILAGLQPEVEGRVLWCGAPWLDSERRIATLPRRRGVGLVSQTPCLFAHMTVRENVAYARQYGKAASTEAEEKAWLEAFGIADLAERGAGLISGGEAQRVALARALAARPSLLLLDEPFAHLDPPARTASQLTLAQALGQRRVPVVQVTHDRGPSALRPRTVWLLWAGRLVAAGTPETVAARAPEGVQRAFLQAFLGESA